MEIRYDFQNKRTLLERFELLLGNDFLMDFSAFISEHEMPDGKDLSIEWHGVRIKAILFEPDCLLILRIYKKKTDTPCTALSVGEKTFYPTEKRPIPLKRK